MSIGSRLRQARVAAGLTAAEVGSRAGLTGSHVSQIERGAADPSLGALSRICEALGIEMGALFSAETPADRPQRSAPRASPQSPCPDVSVVRVHERSTIVRPGSRQRHEMLCSDLRRTLEAFRTILPPGRLAFAGQDLVQSGFVAADYLAQALNGSGNVIITTYDVNGQWSIDRETGARRAFARYPGIRVHQTVSIDIPVGGGVAQLEAALHAFPELNGICGLDWLTAQCAARYIRDHAAWRHVKIVGFDEIPASLELLRGGYITAIFTQAAERQAYEAVHMLVDFLNGKPIYSVDTGIGRLDRTNVAQYLAGSPPVQEVKRGSPVDPRGFPLNPRIARRVAAGERLFIPVSFLTLSDELTAFLRAGVERAAREFNVDAVLVGPPTYDPAAQVAELEGLAARGVDGLAISSGITELMAPVIDRFLGKGIPVVTYNTDNPQSGRLAFVGQEENGVGDPHAPSSHEGEEWAMVLKGTIEFVIQDQSYTLNPGDAVQFNCRLRHHWKNLGSSEAELLWVATPPHF